MLRQEKALIGMTTTSLFDVQSALAAESGQHGKAVLRGDRTPFADGIQLHAK